MELRNLTTTTLLNQYNFLLYSEYLHLYSQISLVLTINFSLQQMKTIKTITKQNANLWSTVAKDLSTKQTHI